MFFEIRFKKDSRKNLIVKVSPLFGEPLRMDTGRMCMIKVTRLNQLIFSINQDLIETVEETPDTVITLTNGKKFVVQETMDQINNLVIAYKQQIYNTSMGTMK